MSNKKVNDKELKFNNKVTLITWLLFGCISISIMLYSLHTKAIVVADENVYQVTDQHVKNTSSLAGVKIDVIDGDMEKLTIPMPRNINADNVSIENIYINKQLWVYLDCDDKDYLEDIVIKGDKGKIIEACYNNTDDKIVFKFQMDGIYEYKNTINDGNLTITINDFHDLYDCVVVVNQAHIDDETLADEKNIVPDIMQKLKSSFSDDRVKLFFAVSEDYTISDKQMLEIIKSVGADFYIRVGLSADNDSKKYGICSYYNDEYYIPKLGNVQIADILAKSVTLSVSNRAIGLFPTDEEDILKRITIPAADIRVGFISNELEYSLLKQESYRDEIAKGLANGILEVYTNWQNSGEEK